MYKFTDLSQLSFFQIDQTSHCNLRCPQCARTVNSGVNPNLPMDELSLVDYQNIFSDEVFKKLEKLDRFTFSGNYGDAVMSNYLKPTITFLKSKGKFNLYIMTNGSLRSPDWWRDLATVLNPETDAVVFAIDGLEETNHIYRVKSNWQKIMENANAFISAGGKARWEFILFEHNEHQLEEAQLLAKKMGFVQFAIKKTKRFINSSNYLSNKLSTEFKTADQIENKNSFENIIKRHGSWSAYINKTEISCMYRKWGNGLFIDFEGRLWPCTWLASPIHHPSENDQQKKQILKIYEKYGEDFNDVRKFGFLNVFNHIWFQEELVKSWSNKIEDDNFKLMTCGRTCGQEYDFSSVSTNNRKVISF